LIGWAAFIATHFLQIFMKSSKIYFIILSEASNLPSGRKNAAGQADSSCPNALSSGGFDYSSPLFLFFISIGGKRRAVCPTVNRQSSMCAVGKFWRYRHSAP
jgi:hypothetical protein